MEETDAAHSIKLGQHTKVTAGEQCLENSAFVVKLDSPITDNFLNS
jgi:hypothetical protein